MKAINRLSDYLDTITKTLTGILLIGLCSLTFVGVVFRFVFNNPITWLYELSIVAFAWIIFLGTAMAFKRQEHIQISFILMKMPSRMRYIWRQMIYLVCIFMMVIVFKDGIGIVQGTWKQTYNTIPISKGVFYLSFTVGSIISAIHLLSNMVSLKLEEIVGVEIINEKVAQKMQIIKIEKSKNILKMAVTSIVHRR